MDLKITWRRRNVENFPKKKKKSQPIYSNFEIHTKLIYWGMLRSVGLQGQNILGLYVGITFEVYMTFKVSET